MTPPGWDGILAPGERILWQGRPEPHLDFTRAGLVQTAFGLPILVYAVIWTVMGSRVADPGPFLRFLLAVGLFFIALGLYLVLGHFLWDAYRRRRTWYTLTDRRAFIATAVLGRRKLRSHALQRIAPQYDGRVPGTIRFAADLRDGFEMIADAPRVLEILRAAQRDLALNGAPAPAEEPPFLTRQIQNGTP